MSSNALRRQRVRVVTDDTALLNELRQLLSQAGASVVGSAGAAEAAPPAVARRPDLVLWDRRVAPESRQPEFAALFETAGRGEGRDAGRAAAETAHDLRTLLTVIHGSAVTALRDVGSDPGTRDLLAEILATTARASALVQVLMSPTRPVTAPAAAVDLGAVVRTLAPTLASLAGARIRLQIDAAESPVWALAAPAKVEQVLLNLVANARDAMPEGGNLLVSVAATPASPEHTPAAAAAAEPQGRATLTVRDTGHGIDPAMMARMFEPFVTTKPDDGHAGLGLSIVDRLVRDLGGTIAVTSAPGRGAAFEVQLPLAAAPRITESSEVPIAAPSALAGDILLVENDGSLRSLLAMTLRRRGHAVIEAGHAGEALERFDAHPAVALLITDVRLPGVSGQELADRLTAREPRLPVLYISGAVDDVALPVTAAFLQKPFTLSSFVQTVRDLLAARSPARDA